jgi:ketosteroid isomerase-like protein
MCRMTTQKIAEQYVRAWLTGDVDTALSLVADDVVCQGPRGTIEGLAGYRQFLEPFAKALLSGDLIDVLADDTHAATVYTTETPFAKDFRGMEYLTVADGKITHIISVFDLSPALKAAGSQG